MLPGVNTGEQINAWISGMAQPVLQVRSIVNQAIGCELPGGIPDLRSNPSAAVRESESDTETLTGQSLWVQVVAGVHAATCFSAQHAGM